MSGGIECLHDGFKNNAYCDRCGSVKDVNGEFRPLTPEERDRNVKLMSLFARDYLGRASELDEGEYSVKIDTYEQGFTKNIEIKIAVKTCPQVTS